MEAPKTKELGQISPIQQLLSIGPNLEQRDIFYFLKMADSNVLWQAFLELQFQFCRIPEIGYLAKSDAFSKAKRVLEIGRGHKEVIGGIASLFPEKEFVDCPLPMKQSLGGKHKTREFLSIIEKKIPEKEKGKFDYLILRVVVQKLSQLGLFIDTVKDYLAPGGTLLIYDADDSVLNWVPQIPTLQRLMTTLRDEMEKNGGGRSAADKIYRRASLYGLKPILNEVLKVRSFGEVGKRDFYTYFLLLSEAMNRAYENTIDQVALLRELDKWLHTDNAYIQMGINLVELNRVTS